MLPIFARTLMSTTALAFGVLATPMTGLASPPPADAPTHPWSGKNHPFTCASGEPCQERDMAAVAERWRARMDNLGLTPEQKAEMKAISQRYQPRGLELAQRGAALRDQVMVVSPDDPGYAAVSEQAAAVAADIAGDTVRLLSEMRAAMHGVLTAEQQQKLRAETTEDRKRWDDWRQRHQAPGK